MCSSLALWLWTTPGSGALARSDVQFVSGERPPGRKRGYALHSIILRMRSPVFASMLASEHTVTNEPIELAESGDELGLFFECLYSNFPQLKLSAGLDVCTVRACLTSMVVRS
jgi:hypothetical protein